MTTSRAIGHRPRRAAFTLLEVMIAISVLAMIGGLVVATLANTVKARDLLAADDGVQQSARVAISRLTRELRLAYLTPSTGAVNTYRTVFIAQDDDPVDTVWLTSLSHRRLYRNTAECDQTEVTLWGEDDPDLRGLSVLLHREAPRIDQEPDKDGVILPLAHGVKRFDLRFLDGSTSEWETTWDTTGADTPNRLPRAVKVVLVLSAPDVEDEDELVDHTFVTTILLDYAKPVTASVFNQGDMPDLLP